MAVAHKLLAVCRVAALNAEFGRPGGRVFFLTRDANRGLAVRLKLGGGGEAVVALQGAQVVSWVGSEWRQHLHCPLPSFDGSHASK